MAPIQVGRFDQFKGADTLLIEVDIGGLATFANDVAMAQALWKASERLTGVTFDLATDTRATA